jgi:hypothetical protein
MILMVRPWPSKSLPSLPVLYTSAMGHHYTAISLSLSLSRTMKFVTLWLAVLVVGVAANGRVVTIVPRGGEAVLPNLLYCLHQHNDPSTSDLISIQVPNAMCGLRTQHHIGRYLGTD